MCQFNHLCVKNYTLDWVCYHGEMSVANFAIFMVYPGPYRLQVIRSMHVSIFTVCVRSNRQHTSHKWFLSSSLCMHCHTEEGLMDKYLMAWLGTVAIL